MIDTATATDARSSARPNSPSRTVALCALFIALLAVSAWISIPLPFSPVPVTLQVMVVVLAALVLTPLQAGASTGGYLVLGAIGIPLFHNATSGLAVLAGPTGGFLTGFMLGAVTGSVVRSLVGRRLGRGAGCLGAPSLLDDIAGAAVCIGCIYAAGWVQLSLVAGVSLPRAFVLGVAPFLAVDVAKAAVAIAIARAVRRTGLV